MAEVFQGQLGPLDVEVSVEPFADGAGAGLHPLDRAAVDEVPKRKYNQIRELDISGAFDLGRFLLFRGREALPLRCIFLSEGRVAGDLLSKSVTALNIAFNRGFSMQESFAGEAPSMTLSAMRLRARELAKAATAQEAPT